jgi:cell division protein FtsL
MSKATKRDIFGGIMPNKVGVGLGFAILAFVFPTLLDVLQMMGVTMPPTVLNIAIIVLIVLGILGIVMVISGIIEWARKTREQKQTIAKQSDDITKLEHNVEILSREYTEAIKPEILKKLKTTGRIDDVSPADSKWIVVKGIEMIAFHGYNDVMGLFADRASGVPLNELMAKPCSYCGIPRNQRGKHDE